MHTTIRSQLNLEDTDVRVDLNLAGAILALLPNPSDNPAFVLDVTSAQIGRSLYLGNGFQAHRKV